MELTCVLVGFCLYFFFLNGFELNKRHTHSPEVTKVEVLRGDHHANLAVRLRIRRTRVLSVGERFRAVALDGLLDCLTKRTEWRTL